MNPELNHDIEAERSNPTILRRLGETVVGIAGAYVGLKLGEDIFHFALPYAVEMGISTAVGSAPINIRYAMLEQRNNLSEQ